MFKDFADLLRHEGVISREQLYHARTLAQMSGVSLQMALVKLGYCTDDLAETAMADVAGIPVIELEDLVNSGRISLCPQAIWAITSYTCS